MKKRLFAGLLSLLMLWTMLPVSALAVGDETEEPQDAYFYVLKPERMDTPGLGTTEIANFYYVGTGEIIGAPAPAITGYAGAKIFIDEANKQWDFTPPTADEVDLKARTITYNDKSYTYVPKEQFDNSTETNKYYIEWYRYSSSLGANSNEEEPIVPSTGNNYCWHIDGYPVFSDRYTINYEVQQPGENAFSPYLENDAPYIQYITKSTGVTVQSVNEPEPDATKDVNGVHYVFEGWYTNEACTEEATDSTLLSSLDKDGDNQITFYGKYVPDTKVYVYAYTTDGNVREYLTEVLGVTLDYNGYFPLGVLSNAELDAATTKYDKYPAADNEKQEVQDTAKNPDNFTISSQYTINDETISYNEIQESVICDWIAAYANDKLTSKLKVVNDTKEFGKERGSLDWHLDIKLTDDILPTITVTPANITIYTGGKGYGGVTDGNGNIITDTQTSNGLPEPGYHIELPPEVQEWLEGSPTTPGGGTAAQNLAEILSFTYDENVENPRTWNLEYQGVYDTNASGTPTQYVYSLEPGGTEQKEVRLQFKDEDKIITSDEFEMGPDTVSKTYDVTIYPGEVNQSEVKAKFTVGGKDFNCKVEVGTGELTVKSVADKDENGQPTTNAIAANESAVADDIITAVANDVKYYVNDSEVDIENTSNRVQLLVDKVSNSDEFNKAIGVDAIAEVEADEGINLAHAYHEAKYLDLVDTENGNAVVTMGEGQSLTIYWPVPADAASDSDFYVVHYEEMDRSEQTATGEAGLSDAKTDVQTVQTTNINGQKYVTFEASGFSPFVLVWGEATPTDPDPEPDPDPGPDPDPDPDPDPHPGGSTTIYYTLEYESNGGTEYNDERYPRNKVVDLDKVPTREGYTFTGWYADEELTERITEIKMTSDKTVYAGWEATGVPDWLNGDDHFAYVIGYPDGMVKPQNNISRAEVATIFFRLLKPEIRDKYLTQTNQFTDVSGSAWYNTAVSTMAALDIVKGRTPTTFVPDAPITRAEFAAVCARFDTHLRDGDSDFSDISGHWAEAEIERAATLGWINGYPDGTFRPDNAITRAEAMTMINRVLQRLPEDEDDLLPDMNVWPDNQPQDWYYLAVQEATNSHDFDRKHDGVHEHWTDMNADPNWTQYQ